MSKLPLHLVFRVVLLVGLPFVLYARSLGYPFTWDDDTHLTQNILRGTRGLYRSWFTSDQPNYWPMTWTAFWLQWKLWGLHPVGYRVINLLLHVGCSILCWRILTRLRVPASWAAAMLFAIHPVNVESVAWVTQLKTLLSSFFFFASILVFLDWDEKGGSPRYLFALFLFVTGLLTKSSVAPLPAVLLAFVSWRGGVEGVRRRLPAVLPWLIPAIMQVGVEIWFQRYRAAGTVVVRDDGIPERVMLAGKVFWFYAWKAIAPLNLSFIYPRWELDITRVTDHLPTILALLLFAALAIASHRKKPGAQAALLGMFYYAVTLLPVLGFATVFFFRYSYVADHYQYASLIALPALLCAAVHYWTRHSPSMRIAGIAGGFLYGCLLASLSWQQQGIYRSLEVLWTETIRINRNAGLAYNNLANIQLFEKNNPQEAIPMYLRAASLQPDDPGIRNNLAFSLLKAGQPDPAEKIIRDTLATAPRFAGGHATLGDILYSTGRTSAAVEAYTKALQLNPGLSQARKQLQECYKELRIFSPGEQKSSSSVSKQSLM